MKISNTVEAYADVVMKIKELEGLKLALNQKIVEKMNDNGETNLKTGNGEFLLAWRKSWEYSNETEHMEVILKENKKREENDGTASVKGQTEYLRFIPLKDQE